MMKIKLKHFFIALILLTSLSFSQKKIIKTSNLNSFYKITDHRILYNIDWTDTPNSLGAIIVLFIKNKKNIKFKKKKEDILLAYIKKQLRKKIEKEIHKLDTNFKFISFYSLNIFKIYVFHDDSPWKKKILEAKTQHMLSQNISQFQNIFSLEKEFFHDTIDINIILTLNHRFKDIFDKNRFIMMIKTQWKDTESDDPFDRKELDYQIIPFYYKYIPPKEDSEAYVEKVYNYPLKDNYRYTPTPNDIK